MSPQLPTTFLVSCSAVLLLGRICSHINPNPAAWHPWRAEPGRLRYTSLEIRGLVRARLWSRQLGHIHQGWGVKHAEHTDGETHFCLDRDLHCLEVIPLGVHYALRDAPKADVYLCPSTQTGSCSPSLRINLNENFAFSGRSPKALQKGSSLGKFDLANLTLTTGASL